MYDNYRNRYPLSGRYLNYWGGRRAWWMHRQDRPGSGKQNWKGRDTTASPPPAATRPSSPGRTPGAVRPRPPATGEATPGRPGRGEGDARPGGWIRRDRDGARPDSGPGGSGATTPPTTRNPATPGTARPRPPATEGESARPRWQGRGDAARPGGTPRPSATERPARVPDAARPSAPPRAAPAPAARPERPAERTGKRDFRTRNQ
jgi:hypothetical protein